MSLWHVSRPSPSLARSSLSPAHEPRRRDAAEDAVDIHFDVRSRKSIGMHWGTWRLTGEDVFEPPKRLSSAIQARGGTDDEFGVTEQGLTVRVTPSSSSAAATATAKEAGTGQGGAGEEKARL